MYSIQETDYGYRLAFKGFIRADEMVQWLRDIEQKLTLRTQPFCLLFDMRELKPLPVDSQPYLESGQALFKSRKLLRSFVVLNNPVAALQLKRISMQTGLCSWERYADIRSDPDWEQKGLDWLRQRIEPEARAVTA